MRFEFATAGRILFGVGSFDNAASICREFGDRICLVVSQNSQRTLDIQEKLTGGASVVITYPVEGEPTLSTVEEGVRLAREAQVDLVVAVGGGSVIDTAKAIGAMLTNPGTLSNYLEVVGDGWKIRERSLPVIAVPTTAGTGAEVTKNAVIGYPEKRVKVSLRSEFLLPRVSIVDPQMSVSMPPDVTASTGMDALTQLIEPFVSSRSTVFVDMLCREGMARVSSALITAYRDGEDLQARTEMSYASLLGGLALANAGLGAVHGFAGVIGGMYSVPHGIVCARLLPAVIRWNQRCMRNIDDHHPTLQKYSEIAKIVLGRQSATGHELDEWVEWLCETMKIPRLRQLGIAPAHFNEIIPFARAASSMKANPVELIDSALMNILEESW